jgi:hypothetical protein
MKDLFGYQSSSLKKNNSKITKKTLFTPKVSHRLPDLPSRDVGPRTRSPEPVLRQARVRA